MNEFLEKLLILRYIYKSFLSYENWLDEMVKKWWKNGEKMVGKWWDGEEMVKNWWKIGEKMVKNWLDEMVKKWWRNGEKLVKNWWKIGEKLVIHQFFTNCVGLHQQCPIAFSGSTQWKSPAITVLHLVVITCEITKCYKWLRSCCFFLFSSCSSAFQIQQRQRDFYLFFYGQTSRLMMQEQSEGY